MIDLYKVIQSHIAKFKNTLYTNTIAEVVQVNLRGDVIESVDVRPSISRIYLDGEIVEKPIIYQVPIIWPSGGGAIISFPLEVGDTVMLVHSKEDITNFLRDRQVSPPDTLRKFSYNDAVAIPCVNPLRDNLDPISNKLELKYKDTKINIDQEGNVEIDCVANVRVINSIQASVNASESITLTTPRVTIDSAETLVTGSLTVSGDITTESDVITSSIPSLNTHKHLGVRTGTDKSGNPTT